MSKITSYQNNIINNLNRTQGTEQQAKIEKKDTTTVMQEESDSVVSDIKPDLSSIEAANSLADKLVFQLQTSPSNALSAQGDLDEARILALLQDDD